MKRGDTVVLKTIKVPLFFLFLQGYVTQILKHVEEKYLKCQMIKEWEKTKWEHVFSVIKSCFKVVITVIPIFLFLFAKASYCM